VSATLVPRRLVHHPAWVRFDEQETTIHLAPWHTRRLRHGHDVTELLLGPAGGSDGRWRLDLVRDGHPVARLVSADWDFDDRHGPAQAATASGLALRRTDVPPEHGASLAPGQLPRWFTALLAVTPLVVLGALVVVLFPDPAWSAAILAIPVVAWVLAARLLELVPRGTPVFGARPEGAVRRAALHARLLRTPGGTALCTVDLARPLPPAGDLLAPTRLHAFRDEHGVDRLAPATDAGHAHAQLERRFWAPGPAADELAVALGGKLVEGRPRTDGGALPLTWKRPASGLATPWLPIAGLHGALVAMAGLDRADSPAGLVATVLGILLLALTAGWGAARWLLRRRLDGTVRVTPAHPVPNGA
jgi:hypothetical protein